MIKIGGFIPPSLSASVFSLPTNKRWIWTIVLFATVKGWKTWTTIVFWGETVYFASTFTYCLI